MGLVSKLKNILFEEEEVEIPVIEKKEKQVVMEPTYKEMPKKEVVKTTDYSDFYEVEQQPKKERVYEEKREVVQEKKQYQDTVSERELFKSEKTFNFPAFDEKEFESAVPRRTTNVLEYERKKEIKKNDYKQPIKKEEPKEIKQKFRPSPIISPVYGILDKNYTPDEITSRQETIITKTLDVDTVRKKAFGSLEEVSVETTNVDFETSLEDRILEERLEKARTIDELLKDSSDEIIEVSKEEPKRMDALDEAIESLEENVEPKHVSNEEDTLESDLFDLIDSMYENREDGE